MSNIISVKNISRVFQQSKKDPGLKGTLKYFFKREIFDINAVNDISFNIEEGEFVGFIGANGAGKTTTLKMLSGILHPTRGEISVLGFNPATRNNKFLKQISLVMGQKNQLQWDLPVIDSLEFNKQVYEVSESEYKKQLDEIVSILEIDDILKIPARKLSLGQRMKCELAASLIHSPKVLFLDEPTIGLDVSIQQNIREFLKKYNKEKNTTIILTSHYMEDIEKLCKRVIIIDKGKIVYDGDLSSLQNQYIENKNITIEFEDSIKDINFPGEVVEKSENIITLSVPKINHLKVVTDILNKYTVKDISISEPSLESIIRGIFDSHKTT